MSVVLGLLLLPLCVAATRTTVHVLASFAGGLTPAVAWFVGGFALWIVLYLCLPRPVRAYVLAHELTHALWAWILGARVSRIRIGAKGGSVTLSKANVWITLAPYCFPLYAAIIAVLNVALSLFFDMRAYQPLWLAALGLTWSFHLTFTASALLERQPDLLEHGRFFSLAFIYWVNVTALGFVLAVIGPLPAGQWLMRWFADVAHVLQVLARGVTALIRWLRRADAPPV